jgi:hypothetical protein
VEFGGVLASCNICSVKAEELEGIEDNGDTDDAEGGGVRGKGLREFTAADLQRCQARYDKPKNVTSLV